MDNLRSVIDAISVEPVFLLYSLGSGLRSILFKTLLYQKVCSNYYPSEICDDLSNENNTEYEEEVQKWTARWSFYDEVVYMIPAIFVTLTVSTWSDQANRMIPILLGPIGVIFVTLTYIPNAIYLESHMIYILIGPFLYGFSGGFMLTFSACISYISVTTLPKMRIIRIAIAESMMTFGTLGSEFASGHLLEAIGFVYCFVISIAVNLASIAYILTAIKANPDNPTATGDNKTDEHEKVSNGGLAKSEKSLTNGNVKPLAPKGLKIEYILGGFRALTKPRPGTRRRQIFLIFGIVNVIIFAGMGVHGVSYLFLRKAPLSWDPTLYGYYSGFSTGISFICLLGVIPLFTKILKVKDAVIVICGVVSSTIGVALFGLSTQTWMVFLCPLSRLLSGANFVALRAGLTKMFDMSETGAIFGVMALMEQVGMLISGALYQSLLYPATVDFFPAFSFLLAAGLHIPALIFAIFWYRYSEDEPTMVYCEDDLMQMDNPNYDYKHDVLQLDSARLEIDLQDEKYTNKAIEVLE